MKVNTPIEKIIDAAEAQVAAWDLLELDRTIRDGLVELYLAPKDTVDPGSWAIRLKVEAHDTRSDRLKFAAQPMMYLNGWHWAQSLSAPNGDHVHALQLWVDFDNRYGVKNACDSRFIQAIEHTYKNNLTFTRRSEKCRQEFIALSFILNANKNTGEFKIGDATGRLRKTPDDKLTVDLTIATTSMDKIARVLEILRE